MDIEIAAREIVDSAVKVHKAMGPGLLESTYQQCLAYELRKRGLRVDCEVPQPISYDGVKIECGYRLDMLIENAIIIENKAVERILPVHEAQILSYIRLGGYPLGFLLNWKVQLMKYGIKRFAGSMLDHYSKARSKD